MRTWGGKHMSNNKQTEQKDEERKTFGKRSKKTMKTTIELTIRFRNLISNLGDFNWKIV